MPLTSISRGWPNHVPITGSTRLERPSFAMTEQVRTLSRDRLTAHLGRVDHRCLRAVRRWLTDFLVD